MEGACHLGGKSGNRNGVSVGLKWPYDRTPSSHTHSQAQKEHGIG